MMQHGLPVLAWLSLEGTCNQCGKCCTFGKTEYGRLVCENLEERALLGQPMATSCRIWADRTPNMPIRMLDAAGVCRATSVCAMRSEDETRAILREGGGFCSLEIKFRTREKVLDN